MSVRAEEGESGDVRKEAEMLLPIFTFLCFGYYFVELRLHVYPLCV